MSDSILPANTDTCLVEFDKKEYAIVGDLFFAKTLEEVPPWFQDLVQDTVVQVNGNTYDTLAQYNISLLAALQGIEVSKNTYEQYINKLVTDQEAFISVLTTLNSTINGNDASIRQLLLTYATEDFAVASAAQLLTASLNGGAIGAAIGSVETAMATQYGAMAQRLQTLETEFTDVAGQQGANASAIQALTTYTGYGVYNGADALIANSNFYNNLNAYLDGTDYYIGGSSTLIQDVTAVSTEKMKQVEAKFEYGSTIELDGKQYNAGFGLVQTGTLLPDGITYDSEFWVKASRFKFTSDAGGTVSPFTIDGSGNAVFNGKVAINNILEAPTYGSGPLSSRPSITTQGSTWTDTSTSPNITYIYNNGWKSVQGLPGTNGTNGTNGTRGASIVTYGADLGSTSIASAASNAGTYFTNGGGINPPIPNDSLVLTNTNTSYGWSNIYKYNGSSWVNSTVLTVNGNAVVNGMAAINGALLAGSEIRSSVYSPGSSGWRIDAAGNAELNGLIVRTGNLANDSVTKMVKEQRFWTQDINTWPTVVNSVTISAGSAPMDVTLIWGGRCGYLKAVECQVQAYKNGSPWIDFGVVGYPSIDMPGWVASDTIAAGTSATYSAILNAAPGIQAEKVTLIAIGRMK